MKELIKKYLNKNYRFTLSTYNSYLLLDRITKVNVHIKELFTMLKKIFNVDDTTLLNIFEIWAKEQETLINNRIVEIQERLYSTGVTIDIPVDEMNKIIEAEERNFYLQNRIIL